VFENRVLKRIFGPRRDKIIGGRIKLHNEELTIYSNIKNHFLPSKEHVTSQTQSRPVNAVSFDLIESLLLAASLSTLQIKHD
jgi:hypothetical protein